MALAESNHHAVPRGQKMARAGRVEREENYEPRLLDPPLPQTAATVGYVAAAGPLLVVPSLAGGDSVDGTALRFLLKQTLALQKEEEEKKRRRKELEEEDTTVRESLERAQRFLDRAGRKRKRKKRKKKKLPRAPRPRQGCRRLCDHQRHVPAVRSTVVTQRQVPTVHSFFPVQLLDKVFDMPVVVLRQVPGLMVQKTVEPPQLQSIFGRRHSLSFRRG